MQRRLPETAGQTHFTPTRWGVHNAGAIAALESAWAPWLQNSTINILTIATRFPQGQIAYGDAFGIAATMTTTRIHWPERRPTWDQIAGVTRRIPGSRNFTGTFTPTGDTFCIMSSSVREDVRGHHLGTRLLQNAIQIATDLGVEQIVGSFRPNGYGEYKLREIDAGRTPVSFTEYCETRGEGGERIDTWLKISERAGMQPLTSPIDEAATVIEVDLATFNNYRHEYAPDRWKKRTDSLEGFEGERWECGETGTWHVLKNRAIYIEPNYWMGRKISINQ